MYPCKSSIFEKTYRLPREGVEVEVWMPWHMREARRLLLRLGGDPDHWTDLNKIADLLDSLLEDRA
jgi:hypothetical protein